MVPNICVLNEFGAIFWMEKVQTINRRELLFYVQLIIQIAANGIFIYKIMKMMIVIILILILLLLVTVAIIRVIKIIIV